MVFSKGFGLIDIIFLILCIIITYEAAARGIFLEILKLIGLFFSLIFSFQFYPFLFTALTAKLPLFAKDYSKFLAFGFLFFSTFLLSDLLSRLVNSLFKREIIPSWEKLIAILIGFVRIAFLSSVIVFLLYLLPINNDFFRKGISKELFKNIAPKIYLVSAKSYKKIQPNFKLNMEVEKLYEVKSHISGSNKKRN